MSIAIGLFLFFGSLAGIVFLVARRLEELKALPEDPEEQQWSELLQAKLLLIRKRFPQGSPDALLQQLLQQVRVLSSKVETKSAEWQDSLRRRSEGYQSQFSQDYWKRLKKGKKETPEKPA